MAWDFSTDPEFEKKLEWMRTFVREEVYPLEVLDADEAGFMLAIRQLQAEVKKQKLWATHLPPELGGQGYGQVKLGPGLPIPAAGGWPGLRAGEARPDARDRRRQRVGADCVRQPGPRLRQLRGPRHLRHRGAEATLAAPTTRWPDPLRVFHDRAQHRRLGPDAALDHRGARPRRVGDQRPQVVHVERHDRRLPHSHGRHRA